MFAAILDNTYPFHFMLSISLEVNVVVSQVKTTIMAASMQSVNVAMILYFIYLQ